MTFYTSWVDPANVCDCGEEGCPRPHPITDKDHRYELRDHAGNPHHFALTMAEMVDIVEDFADDPLLPGEAEIVDLATSARLDAAKWAKKYCH